VPKADSGKGRQSGGQSFVSELGPLRASVSLARSVTLSRAFLQSSGKGSSKGSDQGSGKSSNQGSVRVSGLCRTFAVFSLLATCISPCCLEQPRYSMLEGLGLFYTAGMAGKASSNGQGVVCLPDTSAPHTRSCS
jgi:hypothetical protein